ncbi:MAG: ferrochelatase [Pseudomonadota bacterium]
MTQGVLLVNLGTPASTDVAAVRRYLGEFLTDPHVINLPTPLRQILVRGVILPFRPKRSAEAYEKIWDAAGPGTGSPLLHYSKALRDALAEQLAPMPVALGMRYGEPSLGRALEELKSAGTTNVKLIALYPQHADSTRATTIEAVEAKLPQGMTLSAQAPFYGDADYLAAQAAVIQRNLPEQWDHLLLSYHGLPEAHLTKADPTGKHCLSTPDCCEVASAAHGTCYRHQARVTSKRVAEHLGLGEDQWSIAFQSRLGRLPWLSPYTDEVLADLPGRGVRKLVVACPAFVADNLETLEEIGMAGRETFLEAGGEAFTLIPCLNADPAWIQVLADWCRRGEAGSGHPAGSGEAADAAKSADTAGPESAVRLHDAAREIADLSGLKLQTSAALSDTAR